MASAPPSTWHVQDWLLAVEALASRTHPEEASAAAERRWWLIETLCAGCGIDPTAYVFCIDDEWSGPPAESSTAGSSPTADLEDRVDDSGDVGVDDVNDVDVDNTSDVGDGSANADNRSTDVSVDDAGDVDANEASDVNDRSETASAPGEELLERLDADDRTTLAAALSAFAERGRSTPRTRRAAVLADSITPGAVSPTPTDNDGSLQSDSFQ